MQGKLAYLREDGNGIMRARAWPTDTAAAVRARVVARRRRRHAALFAARCERAPGWSACMCVHDTSSQPHNALGVSI